MTYELVKKLKDAGFPQIGKIGAQYYNFTSHPRMGIPSQYAVTTQISDGEDYFTHSDFVKIPTLDELIEACGEKFFSLERYHQHIGASLGLPAPIWFAAKSTDMEHSEVGEIGSTPSEAVSNLWLELNKK